MALPNSISLSTLVIVHDGNFHKTYDRGSLGKVSHNLTYKLIQPQLLRRYFYILWNVTKCLSITVSLSSILESFLTQRNRSNGFYYFLTTSEQLVKALQCFIITLTLYQSLYSCASFNWNRGVKLSLKGVIINPLY